MCILPKKSDKKMNNNEYLNLLELLTHLTKMFKYAFFLNKVATILIQEGYFFTRKGKYLHKSIKTCRCQCTYQRHLLLNLSWLDLSNVNK